MKRLHAQFAVSSHWFDAAKAAGLMMLDADPVPDRPSHLMLHGTPPQEVVDFTRCMYTGLNVDHRLASAGIYTLRQYGGLHWSVARTRVTMGVIAELEDLLSTLFSAKVVTFPSVSCASESLLPLIAGGFLTNGVEPVMVCDAKIHRSMAVLKPIMRKERPVITIAHQDWDSVEAACAEYPDRPVCLVIDGIWSMGGLTDMGRLRILLARHPNLHVYIDDAHGISLYGERGEGYARSELGPDFSERTIIVTSLSKGFGASGAAVLLLAKEQVEIVRRYAIGQAFIHPMTSVDAAMACASARIHLGREIKAIQARFWQNVYLFDQLAEDSCVDRGSRSPVRRVVLGSPERAIAVAAQLRREGYLVSPVFFPTVPDEESGLRICLSAVHDRAEITVFAHLLHHLVQEM